MISVKLNKNSCTAICKTETENNQFDIWIDIEGNFHTLYCWNDNFDSGEEHMIITSREELKNIVACLQHVLDNS